MKTKTKCLFSHLMLGAVILAALMALSGCPNIFSAMGGSGSGGGGGGGGGTPPPAATLTGIYIDPSNAHINNSSTSTKQFSVKDTYSDGSEVAIGTGITWEFDTSGEPTDTTGTTISSSGLLTVSDAESTDPLKVKATVSGFSATATVGVSSTDTAAISVTPKTITFAPGTTSMNIIVANTGTNDTGALTVPSGTATASTTGTGVNVGASAEIIAITLNPASLPKQLTPFTQTITVSAANDGATDTFTVTVANPLANYIVSLTAGSAAVPNVVALDASVTLTTANLTTIEGLVTPAAKYVSLNFTADSSTATADFSPIKQKTYITGITLGSGFTAIAADAFSGYSNLVNVSTSATSIGDNAFLNCTALTTVTSGSVTSIGERAFFNCAAYTTIPALSNAITIGASAFQGSGITGGQLTLAPLPPLEPARSRTSPVLSG